MCDIVLLRFVCSALAQLVSAICILNIAKCIIVAINSIVVGLAAEGLVTRPEVQQERLILLRRGKGVTNLLLWHSVMVWPWKTGKYPRNR